MNLRRSGRGLLACLEYFLILKLMVAGKISSRFLPEKIFFTEIGVKNYNSANLKNAKHTLMCLLIKMCNVPTVHPMELYTFIFWLSNNQQYKNIIHHVFNRSEITKLKTLYFIKMRCTVYTTALYTPQHNNL